MARRLFKGLVRGFRGAGEVVGEEAGEMVGEGCELVGSHPCWLTEASFLFVVI